MSDNTTPWSHRAPEEPSPAARNPSHWPVDLVRPEARDGYWLTPWFEQRLARELEACRSLEALQAIEARIQRRYAATPEWRAVNDAALAPLREIARSRRRTLGVQ